MSRYVLIFLFLVSGLALPAYAQNVSAVQTTATIRGSVVQLDWVAGKVVVRTYDFDNELDEITFFVTSKTKISKNGETAYSFDLQQGDNVAVVYESKANAFAGLQALSITVAN